MTARFAVRTVDFDHSNPGDAEVTREPRTPAAGRFDTDLIDRSEALHPAQQARITSCGRRERSSVELAAGGRVEHCGDMDVVVGIDTARDATVCRCHHGYWFFQSLKQTGGLGEPRSEADKTARGLGQQVPMRSRNRPERSGNGGPA
jgi:hypothetical protein